MAPEEFPGPPTAADMQRRIADARALMEDDRAKHWHIGKEVPLALVGALLMQTVGIVWWLAQLSSSVVTLKQDFADFKTDRTQFMQTLYSREDARRDRELLDQKLVSQSAVDREMERRITINDARIERLERESHKK